MTRTAATLFTTPAQRLLSMAGAAAVTLTLLLSQLQVASSVRADELQAREACRTPVAQQTVVVTGRRALKA